MQKSRHAPALPGQIVVSSDRLGRFGVDELYPALLEDVDRLRSRLEALLTATAQDNDVWSERQQLVRIGRLDPRVMLGAVLAPIPLSGATGPQLDVLESAEADDLDLAPTVLTYLGRLLCVGYRARIGAEALSITRRLTLGGGA